MYRGQRACPPLDLARTSLPPPSFFRRQRFLELPRVSAAYAAARDTRLNVAIAAVSATDNRGVAISAQLQKREEDTSTIRKLSVLPLF